MLIYYCGNINNKTIKMTWSLWMMSNRNICNSRLYSTLRNDISKKMSIIQTGRKHSESTKQKMSESAKCKPPTSDETRKKMSNSQKRTSVF